MTSEKQIFNEKIRRRATTADLLRTNCAFLLKDLYPFCEEQLEPTRIIAFARKNGCFDDVIRLADQICLIIAKNLSLHSTSFYKSIRAIRVKLEETVPELTEEETSRIIGSPLIDLISINENLEELALKFLESNIS